MLQVEFPILGAIPKSGVKMATPLKYGLWGY